MKKLLRFFLALALILQLAGKLNAQYFALPDSGLYNWLNTHGCSSCLSPPNFLDTVCAGNFSCSTCVLTMTMDNANIHNLSGIQFFKNLAQLSCSVNHLTFIPPLPPLVEYLRCDNNPLDSLPPLSPPMSRLFCSFTHIKRLPSLPASMNQLYIGYDSLLTDVDNLPRDLGDLLITSDPSLTCLPYIHSITGAFSLRHTPIGCFANYPNNFSSDVPLHSIPLCWVYNPNNCYAYTNLTGTFYKDDNHNCTMDSGENGLGNCKMMLKQNGSLLQICYTNAQGVYAFSGSTPNSYQVEVDTSNLPFSVTCPVGGVDSVTLSTQHPYDTLLNFAAECGSSFDLAGYNLMAYRLRAGVVNDVLFRAGDMANFFNTICASGISGQVQLIFNGPVSYYGTSLGTLPPSSISNDTLTWLIPDFGNFSALNNFDLKFRVDSLAQIGNSVCFTLVVDPLTGDNNTANNILYQCYTVKGAYDPNEKEVYPEGYIDANQGWLTYTVHFQNTGNDTARKVSIMDTLDASLDVSSFQLLAYSAPALVNIDNNIATFNFPDINLPDSSMNQQASRGYVQYKIKLKPNLPGGDSIRNTAYIYFDFNAAIATNTTLNVINLATTINQSTRDIEPNVVLHPNPARDLININTSSFKPEVITIYDMQGRKITETKFAASIDVSRFIPGIYIMEITGGEGSLRKRWIKQ